MLSIVRSTALPDCEKFTPTAINAGLDRNTRSSSQLGFDEIWPSSSHLQCLQTCIYINCTVLYAVNVEFLVRGMRGPVEAALASAPVVVLEGLRVTGKTTLARSLVGEDRFVSLADAQTRRRAIEDPTGWLEALPFNVAIDEAQLVPGLSVAVKDIVDRRGGRPGQFLLTGSSRIDRHELGGSDPLAGRARRLRLEPFTQSELHGSPRDLVSALFDSDPRDWHVEPSSHGDFVRRFSAGGLPLISTIDAKHRPAALADYVEALFAGDVYRTGRDTSAVIRLFHHLATTSGHLAFGSRIATALELNQRTVQEYLAILQDVFLVRAIDAFRPDPSKRITDRQRLFVADPAFVADALQISEQDGLFDADHGPFLETVVANELARLAGWSDARVQLGHWRRADRDEVDLVLAHGDGRLVAVEVKSGRSLHTNATRGIEQFRSAYGDQFHRGFVVHAGNHVQALADGVWAVPFSALWTVGRPIESSLSDRLSLAVETIRTSHMQPAEPTPLDTTAVYDLLARAGRDLGAIGRELNGLGLTTALKVPIGMPVQPTGIGPEGRRAGWTSRPPGTTWTGKTELVVGHVSECTIAVSVDVVRGAITWNVNISGAFVNAFGGLFQTGIGPGAYVAVSNRLKLVADTLPVIVAQLS